MKPPYWDEAKTHLAGVDPVLRRIIADHPDANLHTRGDAFQTLARSIVGQQISVRASQTIWDRFTAAVGEVHPTQVLAHDPDALRAVGLSRMKVAYLKDLADAYLQARLQPERWPEMDDEAVIADLVQVKGIGRWSVEMFLMFHLMRPDVMPLGDLGLQRAMERHYRDGAALDKAGMRALASAWAPWRSVAVWYLWRSMDPVPVEY